jgi:hypothetical protein
MSKLRSAPEEVGEAQDFVQAMPDPEVAEEADLDFIWR